MRETLPELAEYEVNTWFGIMAPAGVPATALQTVNLEIKALLELPATIARFAEMGGVPAYGTPEQFAAFIQSEITKWGAALRGREGVQLDLDDSRGMPLASISDQSHGLFSALVMRVVEMSTTGGGTSGIVHVLKHGVAGRTVPGATARRPRSTTATTVGRSAGSGRGCCRP